MVLSKKEQDEIKRNIKIALKGLYLVLIETLDDTVIIEKDLRADGWYDDEKDVIEINKRLRKNPKQRRITVYHEGYHRLFKQLDISTGIGFTDKEIEILGQLTYDTINELKLKHYRIEPGEMPIHEGATEKPIIASGYLVKSDKVLLVYYKKIKDWVPVGKHILSYETPEECVLRAFRDLTNLEPTILSRNSFSLDNILSTPEVIYIDDKFARYKRRKDIIMAYYCISKNGYKVKIDRRSISDYGWFTHDDLDRANIDGRIKVIAKKALETVNSN